MTGTEDLVGLTAQFDRSSISGYLADVEAEREKVNATFPLGDWADLTLEEYALGAAPGGPRNFCRLMEYGTDAFGSIRGGSAAKHIIYRHHSGEWRLPAPLLSFSVDKAWLRVRSDFVSAFEACATGDFEALDDLETLAYGQALVTKALTFYFPDEFIPIFSAQHLRRFADILDPGSASALRGMRTWQANRWLLDKVSGTAAFAGWSPHEVMHFLYETFDPRVPQRDVWKLSPGRQAAVWDQCLADKVIRVSWGAVGDLGRYESDTELRDALDEHWPERSAGHLRLARQLLAFRDLERGDTVVANRGKSHVLALGTVTGGYEYQAEHDDHAHTVPVAWDTSSAVDLETPVNAWQSSFAKVPPALLRRIRSLADGAVTAAPDASTPATSTPVPNVPRFHVAEDTSKVVRDVVDMLERCGQVILYGPPGTGKTRLAFSAALALAGQSGAIDAPSEARNDAITALLSHAAERRADAHLITFHPSYGYEDFVEGFRPDPSSDGAGLRLALKDGLFKRLCATAAAAPERTVILIIDEINRGDLPRILGELVTVLEKSKRGFPVTLPTSGNTLTVPDNLLVIGTMNTADRSIGHIDGAIRRRFGFVEVTPDSDVVAGSAGPLDLTQFLDGLNARIARELGGDHRIGHAYLLDGNDNVVAAEEDFAAAFYHRIVPLLDDLCLGQGTLLRALLGELVDVGTGRVAQRPPQDLVQALATEFIAGEEAPNAS